MCGLGEQEEWSGCSPPTLPSSPAYLPTGQPSRPRLRASNEHCRIVRVPRAGGRPGCPFLFSVIVRHGSQITSTREQRRSPKEAQASDHARDRPTICAVAVACASCVHESGAGLAADRAGRRDLCPHPPPMARRQLDLSRVLQADRDLVSLSPFTRQASRRDVEGIRIALPRACDRDHHT